MSVLSRIGIALDSDLLKRFDRSMRHRGYTNRSEAFRDLIRDRLVKEPVSYTHLRRRRNSRGQQTTPDEARPLSPR